MAPFLDDTQPLDVQLDLLCRLHNTLEASTLVKNFVDLPLQNMRELVMYVTSFWQLAVGGANVGYALQGYVVVLQRYA